jgi:hypothetical protein
MAFVDQCRLCGTDTLNILRNAIFEGEVRLNNFALKISECLTLQVKCLHLRSYRVAQFGLRSVQLMGVFIEAIDYVFSLQL